MSVKLSDIAKIAGVSVTTVSHTLNHPEKVKESTRNKVLKVIKEMGYKPNVSHRTNVAKKYLEYKNFMTKKPNDTVLSRWGMYTQDKRYKDYTASIVNMIMKDMHINTDQAYYMLYYMVSNNIDDYERAKQDMYVDENFELYRTKRNKVL
jgi:DNA-binding LacI/PurR family transcriptional regulator